VVAEVALALVLLVGAGLLLRSFAELRRAPLGYDSAGVLSVGVGLPQHRYPDPPRWRAFHQQLLERVSALPGVTSAATVTLRPLWGTVGMDWPFTVEGQSPKDAERNPLLNFETVSPDYFRTMGIVVKRGRVFTTADAEGQPGVVVVSESVARRAWPGEDPVGKRLKIPLPPTPYHDTWLTVVGVVADARYREIQASRFDLYMSFLQSDHGPNHLVVRSSTDPAALVPAIREVVRGLDSDQPVTEAATMTQIVSEALGGPRFAARVFGAFAVVALLLAALGLYGLLAYAVSRRTREIGVRMAVGASPGNVRRLVLREGLGLTVAGIVLGLFAAAAGARLLGTLLYEVRPSDPVTFAAVPILLLGVAGLACLLPARRATRVDPIVALRTD
jgi:putative ABC transport system permease protein